MSLPSHTDHPEGKEAPALLQKCALWFTESYRFVYVPDPSEDFRKQFNVDKLPQLQIMIPVPDEKDRVGLRAIPYDRSKFGALKFKNVLRFLGQAEMELRKGNMWPAKPEVCAASAIQWH